MAVRVMLELDETLYEKWNILARDMGSTLEHLLASALVDSYEDQRENAEAMLAGARDIEAGQVIPHEEVVAWIGSLSTDTPLPNPADRFKRELAS